MSVEVEWEYFEELERNRVVMARYYIEKEIRKLLHAHFPEVNIENIRIDWKDNDYGTR